MQTLQKNLSVVWRIFFSRSTDFSLCLHKAFRFIKLCISDNKGNISSTRISMLIIVLWFLADWLMEFHSKGIYTLTWEKLSLLTSTFGLKAVQNITENSNNNSSGNNPPAP